LPRFRKPGIPVIDVRFPEWRENNQHIKYPFRDSATLTNTQGDVLPDPLFVDIVLYPVTSSVNFYLSTVVIELTAVTFSFSGETGVVCSVEVTKSSLPVTAQLEDTYGRAAGQVVFDSTALLQVSGWSPGTYMFSSSATAIVPDATIPTPEKGVRGFLTENSSLAVSDTVYLVAEDGVTIDVTGSEIQVNALGDPLFKRKACEVESGALFSGPFLKTINNVGPNAEGVFHFYVGTDLVTDPVLRIDRVDGGLKAYFVATRGTGNG